MMKNRGLPWVNYDESILSVREYKDAAREQFVMRGVTAVVSEFQQRRFPEQPLDMLYLVDVLSKMFEQREALARILGGECLGWWTEE